MDDDAVSALCGIPGSAPGVSVHALVTTNPYLPRSQPISCDVRLSLAASYWNVVAGWELLIFPPVPFVKWKETPDPADLNTPWAGLCYDHLGPNPAIWIKPEYRANMPIIAHEVGHAMGWGHLGDDPRITQGIMTVNLDMVFDRELLRNAGYRVVDTSLPGPIVATETDRQRRAREREERRRLRAAAREERRRNR